MPELSPEEALRQEIAKFYEERLGRDFSTKPPWQLRKTRDIARALNHPDITKDLSVLSFCTKDSIMQLRQILIEHFMNYGLGLEVTESLLLYFVTNDMTFIIASTQIDRLRFYNEDLKIAGPTDDPKQTYKVLMDDMKRGDPHMNIRIGRSATKEDVIWFINKYWDTDIEPVSNPHAAKKPSVRGKPKLLRDLTIYALRRDGWKYADIQRFIQDSYDELVEEAYLRKVYERTKPIHDLFGDAAKQVTELYDDKLPLKQFRLDFIIDGKQSHFTLLKV